MAKETPMDDSNNSETSSCSYFISTKGNYAVIAFSGVLDNQCSEIFEEIHDKLFFEGELEACFYILCFAGVEIFSPTATREMTKLQNKIREKGNLIRVCGFKFSHQTEFISNGIIRRQEIKKNIADAVKGFIKIKRNKESKR